MGPDAVGQDPARARCSWGSKSRSATSRRSSCTAISSCRSSSSVSRCCSSGRSSDRLKTLMAIKLRARRSWRPRPALAGHRGASPGFRLRRRASTRARRRCRRRAASPVRTTATFSPSFDAARGAGACRCRAHRQAERAARPARHTGARRRSPCAGRKAARRQPCRGGRGRGASRAAVASGDGGGELPLLSRGADPPATAGE